MIYLAQSASHLRFESFRVLIQDLLLCPFHFIEVVQRVVAVEAFAIVAQIPCKIDPRAPVIHFTVAMARPTCLFALHPLVIFTITRCSTQQDFQWKKWKKQQATCHLVTNFETDGRLLQR